MSPSPFYPAATTVPVPAPAAAPPGALGSGPTPSKRPRRTLVWALGAALCAAGAAHAIDISPRPLPTPPEPAANAAPAAQLRFTQSVTTNGGEGLRLWSGHWWDTGTGFLRACPAEASSASEASACATAPLWDAGAALAALAPSQRRLFSARASQAGASALSGFAWQWAELDAASQARLNGTDGQGEARLAHSRGERAGEGSLWRLRQPSLLGAVVNAAPLWVAGPGPRLPALSHPQHALLRQRNAQRPAVLYQAANDGLLHAFDGASGQPLWAFVPPAAQPHLLAHSRLGVRHHFSVDASPMAADVQDPNGQWRSLLVGVLGAGGLAYFALDISDQADFAGASESALSALARWEFNPQVAPDLGHSQLQAPLHPVLHIPQQIGRSAAPGQPAGAWWVWLGNGFGSPAGRALLWPLDAWSGQPQAALVAAAGPDNGLATPTPIDSDQDGLIDTAYAGDLRGDLHKFQWRSSSASSAWAAAPAGDAQASWRHVGVLLRTGQPITTAPLVLPGCQGRGWWIGIGSGLLLQNSDPADTSARGIFAINDQAPWPAQPWLASQLPSLSAQTTPTGRRQWQAAEPANGPAPGWHFPLSGGERVLSNAIALPDGQQVLFATSSPQHSPGHSAPAPHLMAFERCSGAAAALLWPGDPNAGAAGNAQGGGSVSGGLALDGAAPLLLGPARRATGALEVACNHSACAPTSGPQLQPPTQPSGRLSWRRW